MRNTALVCPSSQDHCICVFWNAVSEKKLFLPSLALLDYIARSLFKYGEL